MRIYINSINNKIIFTKNETNKFCMTFHDEYIGLIENENAKEIIQVNIELDENGAMEIGSELRAIFKMRNLLDRVIECVGPYDIFGKKGYMIHCEGYKTQNPALEGALLEKIDWERN